MISIFNLMNDPLSHLRKKRNDYLLLPFREYLAKYYSDSTYLDSWKKLKGGLTRMNKILKGDVYSTNMGLNKPVEDVRVFYDKLERDGRFDSDLALFFTMLMSAGFFDFYQIDFDNWIKTKNYRNPKSNRDEDNDDYTISEALSYPSGQNWIKSRISSLEFWRILGGH